MGCLYVIDCDNVMHCNDELSIVIHMHDTGRSLECEVNFSGYSGVKDYGNK
jgi:hypothetical protein